MAELISVRMTLVGDASVGKTFIHNAWTTKRFSTEPVHNWVDPYSLHLKLGRQGYSICFCDTAGAEMFDRLRYLSYPGTDVFLICYDVASPPSFWNVRSKWVTEIRQRHPDTPTLLVGTKVDLRGDESVEKTLDQQGLKFISESEGEAMAAEIGALKYLECSAKTQYQLTQIFQETVVAAMMNREEKKAKEEKPKQGCFVM